MTTFPVDGIIPRIHAVLASAPAVIIQAPPGTGKSTRIPLALLDSVWLKGNKILMLEPRRLAAFNLASWISAGIGEAVGETVGYSIRFARKASLRTRLEILTEGILIKRLQADPFLESVGAVIFDEFHERSIHSDTALALCLYLQRSVRPDLKIIIMSATLETADAADLIPEAEIIICDGALFPVDVRYLGLVDGDPARGAANAVVIALKEHPGDVLVFLPGSGEIRRCLAILEDILPGGNPLLLPLYGDLSYADQEKAIKATEQRKVVLATNIAETSLTIEGVRVVVDTGLVRRSRFDHSRAIDRLVTERISKASATQRAGRSGRTAPGVCYRLWSEYQQSTLLLFDPPEILTADLAELALNLALWGVHDVAELSFPDLPPAGALAESRRLLRLLAALDENERITDRGRRLAGLPLHPRLGTLLLTACDEGYGAVGADIAAIISERDFLKNVSGKRAQSLDLIDRVDTLLQWRSNPDLIRQGGAVDVASIRTTDRLASQLRRMLSIHADAASPSHETVALLLASAFPDRIAKQREVGSDNYLLASGKGAVLSLQSGLRNEKFIVVIRLDGGAGSDGRIYSAVAVDDGQLKKKFPRLFSRRRTASWDSSLRRVIVREEQLLGAITLESRAVKATPADIMPALLAQLRSSGRSDLFIRSPLSDQYRARIEFTRNLFPHEDWPDLSDDHLVETAEEWLAAVIDSEEKFSGIDLLAVYREILGWKKGQELERLAPVSISVPSGSRIKIDYTGEGGPSIAVKLQELFGLRETPALADGKFPLVIQLLSPAGRPIQITRDLQGFWNSGYQDVRKELKGRYPKHPWPDDPWSAEPTKLLKRHLQG